jgi:hypothetical protein
MKLPRPPKKVKPDPNAAAAAPVDPAAPAAAAPAQSDETPEVQIENPPGTSAADPAPAASAAPAGEEKKDVLAPPVEGFGKVRVATISDLSYMFKILSRQFGYVGVCCF